MVIADLYECTASCGVCFFRPGNRGDDRDPPTCSCGLLMRAAGHLIW